MKTIALKSLQLLNFKGIRSLKIDFDNQTTDIFGDNGTGKTSIFDSVTWLLFGKDSTDRKDFEIKTLDSNGKPIEKLDHEVCGVFMVDNEPLTIKRVLRENWVKKRGSLEAEFSGNQTTYFWNDVPVNQTEFNNKISGILDEKIFKMITNPLAFNGLKWQDRRNVLLQMAGDISDKELAAGNTEYENLLSMLTQGKTLEDYKKQVTASIKIAKDEIKMIPSRIDEVERGKPEAYDFKALRSELTTKEAELKSVDNQLQDAAAAFDAKLEGINKQKLELNKLKHQAEDAKAAAAREADIRLKPDDSILAGHTTMLTQKQNELTTAKNALTTLTDKHKSVCDQIGIIEGRITAKREDWGEENAKALNFNDNDFCCPACKRAFEADDIEAKKAELTTNFNTAKSQKLNDISNAGKALGVEKSNLETERDNLAQRIETGKGLIAELEAKITELKDLIDIEKEKVDTDTLPSRESIIESILLGDTVYSTLITKITELESNIQQVPAVDNEALKQSKAAIQTDIDQLKTKLRNEQQIQAADTRKEELLAEESKLAQQIADVEKIHFTIENFNKLKIDALEAKINSRFKVVKFKMFDQQINGGEVECCEPMINGVPFTDANTASRINAGLDIINTLCEFYQVTAPVFLDNRESVIQLINTESQLVNLIASGDCKQLKVA